MSRRLAGAPAQTLHRRDQAVAAPRNGLDVTRAVVVPERLPKLGHLNAKRRLNDDHVGPDTTCQILLGHHLTRVFQEHFQKVEGSAAQRNRHAAAVHLSLRDDNLERAEGDLVIQYRSFFTVRRAKNGVAPLRCNPFAARGRAGSNSHV